MHIAEPSAVHEVTVDGQVPYSLPSPVMRPRSLPGTETKLFMWKAKSASVLAPICMHVVD
jgi:hypothetical protein